MNLPDERSFNRWFIIISCLVVIVLVLLHYFWQGYVVPEAFTHGTSEQRVRWLRQGLTTGDMRKCDTFAARQL